jgi:anthranilate 1,2-dioxygenase small subunit
LADRHHVFRRARDDAGPRHSAQKSDRVPHVYRHIVSSILIDRAADGSFEVESGFQILRTAAEGSTVIYGCGRYLDEVVAQDGRMLFRKRTVILDSSRIDTLLVIPL